MVERLGGVYLFLRVLTDFGDGQQQIPGVSNNVVQFADPAEQLLLLLPSHNRLGVSDDSDELEEDNSKQVMVTKTKKPKRNRSSGRSFVARCRPCLLWRFLPPIIGCSPRTASGSAARPPVGSSKTLTKIFAWWVASPLASSSGLSTVTSFDLESCSCTRIFICSRRA